MASVKLIVGLGNPGKEYQKTRHNVGFMVVDKLVSDADSNDDWTLESKHKALIFKFSVENVMIVKPQTFMNSSGDAVSSLVNLYKILPSDVYIIHDDLDIKLGEYKIQRGKGPKDHGGIDSVNMSLGFEDYWRVRVGVDNRESDKWVTGEDYVLQDFLPDENKVVNGVILEIVSKLKDVHKRQITT